MLRIAPGGLWRDIEHSIFDFVGGSVASSRIVHSAPDGIEERIGEAVASVVADVMSSRPTPARV